MWLGTIWSGGGAREIILMLILSFYYKKNSTGFDLSFSYIGSDILGSDKVGW